MMIINSIDGSCTVVFTPSPMASEEQEANMDDQLLNNLSFSSLLFDMVRPFSDANAPQLGKCSTSQGSIFDGYSFIRTPDLAPLTPEKLNLTNGECAQGNAFGLEGNNEGFEGLVGEQVVRGNNDAEVIDLKDNDAIDSDKKVQSKAKKKRHRPKVITESKPRVPKKGVRQSNPKKESHKKRKAKDDISAVKKDEIKLKRPRTQRKRKQSASDPTVKVPETPDKVETPSTKRNECFMLNFGGESCSYTSDFMTPESGNKYIIEGNEAGQSSMATHSTGVLVDIMNSSEIPFEGFTGLLMAQEHKRVKRSLTFSTDEGTISHQECCSGFQITEENRSNFFANENLAEMSMNRLYAQRTADTCVSSNVHEQMKESSSSQTMCCSSKDNTFPLKGSENASFVPHPSEIDLDGSAIYSSLLATNNGRKDNSENLNSQALVLHSQSNSIVPLEKIPKRQRPRVVLDEPTTRVWKLLMDNFNNEGVDGTGEHDKAYWKSERDIFLGRANNFIAKMHLVQGDRRFSCWKGSVVDSVVGVFLTQNVADNLSSSAFMSMAARFPNKVKAVQEIYDACFPDTVEEVQEICDYGFPDKGKELQRIRDDPFPNKGKEVEEIYDAPFPYDGNGLQEICDETYVIFKSLEAKLFPRISSFIDFGPSTDGPEKSNEAPKSDCGESSHASNDGKEQQRNSNLDESNGSPVTSTLLVEELEAKEPQRNSNIDELKSSQVSPLLLHEELDSNEPHRNSNIDQSIASLVSSTMLLEEHDAKQPQRNSISNESNVSQVSSTMLVEEHHAKQPKRKSITDKTHATRNSNIDEANGSQVSSSTLAVEHEAKGPQRNLRNEESNSSRVSSSMPGEDRELGGSSLEFIELMNLFNKDFMISAEDNMIKANSETTVIGNEAVQSMEVAAETVESTQKAIDLEKKIKKIHEAKRKAKSRRVGDEIKENFDWNELRKQTLARTGKTNRSEESKDALDWEAVRCADIEDVADTIRERGMNNMLAERIKAFLDKLMADFGSIDLEWIRDIDPDRAKEYLLTIRGLGLKSVECVRLLTLHQHAFPVDTNVGRIAVRLGWVPLHPLPESLQLHLLELYPILDSIQKYLWPRLCKLDQKTLYELHYQMITFGKVFCTKNKPNCNACPLRAECRHFASAFASARLALPSSSTQQETPPTTESLAVSTHKTEPIAEPVPQFIGWNENPIVELPPDSPDPLKPYEMSDYSDDDEIPAITQNMENLSQNLQEIMNLQDCEDLSKAIVALTREATSIPTPKLKNISRLRTEHLVYELPDSHPLVQQMEAREPDDPSFYLFAIWSPGEAEAALNCCADDSQTFGTLLIPCRTAMRGRFPLNGTYFQVNEVFADHESSQRPIAVHRESLWNLHRRTVYFGTSVSSIFKGLCTEEIQRCFWKGFVCVRGFDRRTRAPRPLMRRLHLAASKVVKEKKTTRKNPNP